MGKKERLLFFGLLGLLAVALILLFATAGSKQAVVRDYQKMKENLSRDNEALVKKTNMALDEKRTLESRLDALQKDFERINREKQDLEKRKKFWEDLRKTIEPGLAEGEHDELNAY